MKPRHSLPGTAALCLILAAAGCGGGKSSSAADAASAHGPIKVWLSNNAQEVAWGKQAVAAWNTAHPTETVSAQEIPSPPTWPGSMSSARSCARSRSP